MPGPCQKNADDDRAIASARFSASVDAAASPLSASAALVALSG